MQDAFPRIGSYDLAAVLGGCIACFSRLKLSVTSQEPLRNKWRGEDQIPARIPKLLLRLKPSEVKAESSLPSVISKSQVTLVL